MCQRMGCLALFGLGGRSALHALAALLVAGALALGAAGTATASSEAWPELPPELQAVREALAKYQDPYVAVRDGYFSTVGCVVYPDGAMGVHFINTGLIAPVPDPMKPPILIYEPGENGRLTLVGVEWLIPLATGIKERPAIFGVPFEGPMAGHEPLMPADLHHYDLHVWLFRENPKGLFHTVNPNVTCPEGLYRLPENPPPKVAHH